MISRNTIKVRVCSHDVDKEAAGRQGGRAAGRQGGEAVAVAGEPRCLFLPDSLPVARDRTFGLVKHGSIEASLSSLVAENRQSFSWLKGRGRLKATTPTKPAEPTEPTEPTEHRYAQLFERRLPAPWGGGANLPSMSRPALSIRL